MEENKSIESREIRGLSLRTVITIILATIASCTTILVAKNSIENKIQNISNDQATFMKINDMNFKIFDVRFKNLETEIDDINKRVNDNTRRLNELPK